jgi:hypothetical protein
MNQALYIDGTTTVYIWADMTSHNIDLIEATKNIEIGQGTQTNNTKVVFNLLHGEADGQEHTYLLTTQGVLVGGWKTDSYNGNFTNLEITDPTTGNDIGYEFSPTS